MHGLPWLRACSRAARCTAGRARSPDLPNDAPNATPLISIQVSPVCRRSWRRRCSYPRRVTTSSQWVASRRTAVVIRPPRARRQRRRSALGGPRGARRAGRSAGHQIDRAHPLYRPASGASAGHVLAATCHGHAHGTLISDTGEATGWANICNQTGEDDDHLAVDDSGGEKNRLAQIRGWPAECTCPPLQHQA